MSIESQIAKQIKKAMKLEKLSNDMGGEGQYIFENNTKGDLFLPRATKSGRKLVRKGEQFLGDSYYFAMVKTHELKLIKEITSPEQEQQQKLLTEQPPTVTNDGAVEYVQHNPQQQYNEGAPVIQPVLLNEAPMDGIKILR